MLPWVACGVINDERVAARAKSRAVVALSSSRRRGSAVGTGDQSRSRSHERVRRAPLYSAAAPRPFVKHRRAEGRAREVEAHARATRRPPARPSPPVALGATPTTRNTIVSARLAPQPAGAAARYSRKTTRQHLELVRARACALRQRKPPTARHGSPPPRALDEIVAALPQSPSAEAYERAARVLVRMSSRATARLSSRGAPRRSSSPSTIRPPPRPSMTGGRSRARRPRQAAPTERAGLVDAQRHH